MILKVNPRKTAWLVVAAVAIAGLNGCPITPETHTPIGKWRITFDWGCDNVQKGTTTFLVYENLRFTDDFASGSTYGDWESALNHVTFWYDNGTVYAGTINSATTMSGTMERYDGLEGCWTANRLSEVP
ncbi:MAG: hypothetical protein AMXMBFR84_28690 [Candidatus Hydrogenedentota bacterium]